MELLLMLLILALIVPAVIAYFIAQRVFELSTKQKHKYPKIVRAVTFLACYLVMFAAIVYAINFLPFHR